MHPSSEVYEAGDCCFRVSVARRLMLPHPAAANDADVVQFYSNKSAAGVICNKPVDPKPHHCYSCRFGWGVDRRHAGLVRCPADVIQSHSGIKVFIGQEVPALTRVVNGQTEHARCLCLSVSVSLCLCLSLSLSHPLSVSPSPWVSLCLSVCVSISLSVSLCLSVCLSVCLAVCLALSVSVCLSVDSTLSLPLSTQLSVQGFSLSLMESTTFRSRSLSTFSVCGRRRRQQQHICPFLYQLPKSSYDSQPNQTAVSKELVAHLVFPRTNPLFISIVCRSHAPTTHRILHQMYPSIAKQFSHLWHAATRRIHWVVRARNGHSCSTVSCTLRWTLVCSYWGAVVCERICTTHFQSGVLFDILAVFVPISLGLLSFRGPRIVRRQAVITDAPNNSIAVFANVQISVLVNSPAAAAEFVIFATSFEIMSILPTLIWASAASVTCSACCTVDVTIDTSSSTRFPRPRISTRAPSWDGNSADLFILRLVSASAVAVLVGSSVPPTWVRLSLAVASLTVLVHSSAHLTRNASPLLHADMPDLIKWTSRSFCWSVNDLRLFLFWLYFYHQRDQSDACTTLVWKRQLYEYRSWSYVSITSHATMK